VAAWTTAFLAGFHDPFRIPLSVDTGLDAPVLAFAALISALSGVLAGIIPARQASRASLAGALRAQTRSCALGGLAMRNGLIVAQVALSVVLLAGAGLFLRTLRNARAEDVTLAPANVLLARLELVTFGYGEARCKLFYRQVLDRVQALPGVRNAALVFIVPLGGTRGGADIVITPPESPSERRRVQVDYNVVSPGYFQTVGLPLLRGRDFTGRDREGAPAVAIVNEQLARRFWPGEDPLGKRFGLTWKGGGEAEVVGVVRDGRFRNYRDVMRPCFYVPWFQVEPREMTLQVRTTGDPMRAAAAVRAEVRALDKDLALPEMLTLESHREMGLSQERLTAALLSGLGVLALALAAVGIHGVMSFAVTRRTREIGIRMALGAHGGQVLRMIVARGLTLVLAGLGIGLGVALALTRLTASLLHGVSPTDPPTFAAAGLLLAGVAVVACYLPALRAASVDPAVTLRHE
jgi:predicted permease